MKTRGDLGLEGRKHKQNLRCTSEISLCRVCTWKCDQARGSGGLGPSPGAGLSLSARLRQGYKGQRAKGLPPPALRHPREASFQSCTCSTYVGGGKITAPPPKSPGHLKAKEKMGEDHSVQRVLPLCTGNNDQRALLCSSDRRRWKGPTFQ